MPWKQKKCESTATKAEVPSQIRFQDIISEYALYEGMKRDVHFIIKYMTT